MAPNWVLLSLFLATFSAKSWGQFLLDDMFGDVGSCEEVCERTYPLHTYEKAVHLGYCRRGCRLFSIINFVDEFSNLNQTRQACADSCAEAYLDEDNQAACLLGCSSQVPVVQRRQKQLESLEPQMSSMFPMMYVHNWYSNMVDKLSQQMSVSWSFYSQSDNGQLVVVRSEPKYYVNTGEGWKQEPDYKTSNYIETNLAEVDNSATPDLQNSQVHAMERDLASDVRPQGRIQASDWLSCIAKKTGVPKMILTGTIFVSAFVMIWICLSSAVTAPDQKVHTQPQQKLSIYGDLEYLRELGEKPLIAGFTPQDLNQNAGPLPIKVKVQRI